MAATVSSFRFGGDVCLHACAYVVDDHICIGVAGVGHEVSVMYVEIATQ